MQGRKPKIIFNHKLSYPAMPSAARAEDGSILVVFRNAPREPKGYTHLHSLSSIMLCRSADGGRSFDRPEEVGREDLLAKQDPHLFVTAEGTVLLYWFRYLFHPESELPQIGKNRELLHIRSKKKKCIATLHGLGMMRSSDNGGTFSAPVAVSRPGIPSWAVRGRAVQLPGGRILQATYARRKGDRYYIDVICSDDDGRTWNTLSSSVASTRRRKSTVIQYVEPSLLYTPDGKVHMFIRTHEGDDTACTSCATSTDRGTTFSRPRMTGIQGFPLDPLLLSDGRVLLCYGWRKSKPYGVRYRIVNPDLSNLESATEYILDGTSRTRDCGYPWVVETEAGTVFATWYATGSDGGTSIRCTSFTV